MSNFPQIRIVLVNTSHPGNIGAAARAMKTMGFAELYLVKPKSFPHSKALAMAAGADDILNNAKVTQTLSEAIRDCQLILGTSSRPRGISLPCLTPRDYAEQIMQTSAAKVALVFGAESSGLTNEELLACHYQIIIPANPDYSALNLAAAVQILCYEVGIAKNLKLPDIPNKNVSLATQTELEGFYEHLTVLLKKIDFLDVDNPKKLLPRLRRLFNRIHLETMEVNILRGVLSAVERKLRNLR